MNMDDTAALIPAQAICLVKKAKTVHYASVWWATQVNCVLRTLMSVLRLPASMVVFVSTSLELGCASVL